MFVGKARISVTRLGEILPFGHFLLEHFFYNICKKAVLKRSLLYLFQHQKQLGVEIFDLQFKI
jgi:hypothetical protein